MLHIVLLTDDPDCMSYIDCTWWEVYTKTGTGLNGGYNGDVQIQLTGFQNGKMYSTRWLELDNPDNNFEFARCDGFKLWTRNFDKLVDMRLRLRNNFRDHESPCFTSTCYDRWQCRWFMVKKSYTDYSKKQPCTWMA